MAINRKKITTGVIAALAASAGVTGFIRWRQRRSADQLYQERARIRLQGMGRSYQPADQPDRMPVPATGSAVGIAPGATAGAVRELLQDEDTGLLSEMVGPLSEYLLAFHRLILALQFRRSHDGIAITGRSLTPDDRANFTEVLERLDGALVNVDEGNLEDGSLDERVYRLTRKVRDAIRNIEYNDDDLFRINGEVRSEGCALLNELRVVGENVEEAIKVLECG